jgi:ferredoxin
MAWSLGVLLLASDSESEEVEPAMYTDSGDWINLGDVRLAQCRTCEKDDLPCTLIKIARQGKTLKIWRCDECVENCKKEAISMREYREWTDGKGQDDVKDNDKDDGKGGMSGKGVVLPASVVMPPPPAPTASSSGSTSQTAVTEELSRINHNTDFLWQEIQDLQKKYTSVMDELVDVKHELAELKDAKRRRIN